MGKKEFYRFRSVDNLLGKYEELEKQEIYFASPEELNDPMEGFRDIFWKGDEIVWRNLFRHYLICFERIFFLFHIQGSEEPISVDAIPIFMDEVGVNDKYKKLLERIMDTFFNNPSIKVIIEELPKKKTPVRRDELLFYVFVAHSIIPEIIHHHYVKNGLVAPRDDVKNIYEINPLKDINRKYFELMGKGMPEDIDHDEFSRALHQSVANVFDELNLIYQYNDLEKGKETRNIRFLLSDFPKLYISLVEKLLYPDWYTACFMSECTNSALWGHYGDNHKGLCLIFNFEEENNSKYIELNTVSGYSSQGVMQGVRKFEFHPIDYMKGFGDIDFFRSLGRLPIATLKSIWYEHEGKISECAEDLFKSEDRWRKMHWDNFYRDITIKTKEWKYEKEHRLIICDLLDSQKDKDNRKLNYKFDAFGGIIFGMKTPLEDKLKIIKIIEEKCRKEGRNDFKFYQSFYSHNKKKVDFTEMNLLKFTHEA